MLILNFGKYNGCMISDVPLSYLFFLSGYCFRRGKRYPLPDDNYAFNYIKENHFYIISASREYLNSLDVMKNYKTPKYCLYCDRKLVPIKSDWKKRSYHKKCWKEMNEKDNISYDSPICSPIGSPTF
jgi:hypothetical protein